MAGYDISVGKDLLPGLLGDQDGLAKRVETVLKRSGWRRSMHTRSAKHWHALEAVLFRFLFWQTGRSHPAV